MSHWPFIAGAYAVALVGTAGLAGWSLAAMRRAERAVDALKGER
jgi:Heme exporter protein D (CcmD)